jgi:phosphoribosylformylglycinamidine synthase
VTLAEAAIGGAWALHGRGATVDLSGYGAGLDASAMLFAEDGARAVVSVAPAHGAELERLAGTHGVPLHRAGTVGPAKGRLTIRCRDGAFSWDIMQLRQTCLDAIPRRMRESDR